MRHLCVLITILLPGSCSKDSETEVEGYISYTIAGKEIKHTGNPRTVKETGKGVFIQQSPDISPGSNSILYTALPTKMS
jgi:hypothetical protein